MRILLVGLSLAKQSALHVVVVVVVFVVVVIVVEAILARITCALGFKKDQTLDPKKLQNLTHDTRNADPNTKRSSTYQRFETARSSL